jgi:peptidoglycan biosynthesis protein MviN/MurJ (putative lipid II flippase)
LKRKTGLLFLLRLIRIGVTILTLSLSAKYFGVSIDRDIWILSFSSMILLDSAIWGPINETFRAKFIFIREEEGEKEALNKTKSLLFFTLIISLLLVFLVIFFPNIVAGLIAPSFKGNQLDSLLTMLVYIAPCLLFNQLIQIGVSILNAYESFFIPEISGFITGGINLILIILLAPVIGIYSLLISYYIGLLILLVLILIQIRKKNIPLFSNFNELSFNHFLVFFMFSLPFFVPYFLGQISGIIEKTIVSSIGVGMISVVDYSRKFSEVITSVLSSVMVTVLVPILSLKFSNKKPKEFVNSFLEVYQLGFLILTFTASIFTSCSYSFVSFLYDKGTISKKILIEISQMTIFYSWSAVGVFIYLIFGMALLSSGLGKKYAFLGVIAQVLCICANLIFVKTYGIYVLPISLFISHFICGFLMFLFFPYKSKMILLASLKYISFLITIVFLVRAINYMFLFSTFPLVNILINSIVICSLMIFMFFVFKLEERFVLINNLKRICKR